MITAALSSEIILIAGDITSAWEYFAPLIRKEVESSILGGQPPRIEPSHEGGVARLRGAAALIFQRHPVSESRSASSSSKNTPHSTRKGRRPSRTGIGAAIESTPRK
jgi:hypothetical protein